MIMAIGVTFSIPCLLELVFRKEYGDMVEQADTTGLKLVGTKTVWVQVPLSLPLNQQKGKTMDKRSELARLETRAATIITRGKCTKSPGVLRKVNRKIAVLRRELGIAA